MKQFSKLGTILLLSTVFGLTACGGEQKSNNQTAPVGLMAASSTNVESSAVESVEKTQQKVKKTTENTVAPSEPVDINTATAEELIIALKGTGVGKAKVEKIIEYRTQHGGFKSIDELTEVKGIGDKTMEKLRNRVTLSASKSETKEKNQDKE